jgi:predicted Zn-dependent protease
MLKQIVLAISLALLVNVPESHTQETMSAEDAYYLGRAVAANILEHYRPYLGNPALTAYLNKICRAITLNSPQLSLFNGYHVLLLDSNEINALATSGGHIFITRGLANIATSEDALAAVLAHEIAHIQLGHGLSLVKEMKLTNELSAVAERAGREASAVAGVEAQQMNLFANSVRDMVNTMVKNGYSRPQEFAADAAAISLLVGAGYDPAALIEVLQVLEREQAHSPGGFNSTHPTPAQRLSYVERSLRTLSKNTTRSFREQRFKAAR